MKKIFFSIVVIAGILIFSETGARFAYSFRYGSLRPMLYGFRSGALKAVALEQIRHTLKKTTDPEIKRGIQKNAGATPVKNSYGFIGPEFNVQKPQGVYRIVSIGGSTTAGGVSIANIVAPYPTYLQKLFDASNELGEFSQARIEVLNAALLGIDMTQVLQRIRFKVLPLDPDLVIISSGWNNLQVIAHTTETFMKRSSSRIIIELNKRSLLVNGMRSLAGRWLHGDKHWYSEYSANVDLDRMGKIIEDHPSFSRYRRDLEKAVRLLQSKDICILLIRQPYQVVPSLIYSPGRLYYVYPIPKIYGIISEISEKYKVPVADLEKGFNQLPQNRKGLLFSDILHLTPEGYFTYAKLIFREISRQGLLQKQGC